VRGLIFAFGIYGVGTKPLKLCYPALYSIAHFLDAWVMNNLFVVGGVAHWNVLFTRYAQD
jgi:hypothetical protein